MRLFNTCLLLFVLPFAAQASTVNTIFVGPKNSLALDNAKQLEQDGKGQSARTITKAFNLAAKSLGSCGNCTVNIKIANGQYFGKAKTGAWFFPDVVAPNASLRIMGGYNDDFTEREPFTNSTILQVSENRSSPVLNFLGRKHALKELVISGLVIDIAPSNNYDAETNSLMRNGSSTYGALSLGYLTTNKLVIADNVFMNAIHGVAEPKIRAMTPNAQVIVRNNFMINNIMNWRVDAGGFKHKIKRYEFTGNSFILNWPYNPDTTTALVGSVIIGNKYSAETVAFAENIFAYNVGGAIMPNFVEGHGPAISVENNLFYENGHLFESDGAEDGAFVGKFNSSGTHISLTMEDVEDDFDWQSANNVSIDPELPIPLVKLKALNQKAQPEEESSPEDDYEVAAESDADEGDEFNIDDLIDEDSFEVEEEFELDEIVDDGDIKNFAPQIVYHPEFLPFPDNSEAEGYGASAQRVVNYD